MRGIQEIIVFCPYTQNCPVKQRQAEKACRTELCILQYDISQCRLIKEAQDESLYFRSNDEKTRPE